MMLNPVELTKWLIEREACFGGLVSGIKRGTVSPHDPRSSAELARGGMQGGDRMAHHGYGEHYGRYLRRFLERPAVVLEVGILQGSGIAIWCDLFPTGVVIGLDIDLDHFNRNVRNLLERGAFQHVTPVIHRFDQLEYAPQRIAEILAGRKIDVFIDDGLHTDEAILTSFASVRPHLADGAVCFMEDNATVAGKLRDRCAGWQVHGLGRLTVIDCTPRRGEDLEGCPPLGEILGEGKFRIVFAHATDPELVVKVVKPKSYHVDPNECEWRNWQRIRDTEYVGFFAPCIEIGPRWMTMSRVAPIGKRRAKMIPAICYSDPKMSNFGIRHDQIVCFDYANILPSEISDEMHLMDSGWPP